MDLKCVELIIRRIVKGQNSEIRIEVLLDFSTQRLKVKTIKPLWK